jgi:hypothetical protein
VIPNTAAWMNHAEAVQSNYFAKTTDDYMPRTAFQQSGNFRPPMQTVAASRSLELSHGFSENEILEECELCSTSSGSSVVREGFEPPTKGL